MNATEQRNANSQAIAKLKKLEDIITPLSKEEFEQLRDNLIAEGCRDPLIVWKRNTKLVLVDGHNRYKICIKHNIPFETRNINFKDIEEVKSWMINNQLGRRNLNPDQISYYRGLKYESIKKRKGGYGYVESKGQSEPSTSSSLAEEFKTSESTIKRDAKFARGLNFIGNLNAKLKNDILSGKAKVKKSDVILFCEMDNQKIKSIKNEADLYNKANNIRSELLGDIEHKLKQQKEGKIAKAQKELEAKEPIFSDWNDRIQKVKGRIISAINRAIETRDADSINELKELVEKLQKLLVEN